MNDLLIQTHDLTVFYGQQRGILNVNLSVERGEVFGFLGPNGAGKTTTLRVLLDVIHPTSGQALIFGLDSQKDGRQIRARIGYLPGEFSPYPNMRGRDFLDLLASLQGNRVASTYRRALCERLDLDPTRKMKQYSHGNKQKIGIVAAFMGKSDLLILDEPTLGLDPLAQNTVLELVREARDEGRTVLFSSHILPEVQAVCDRVGIVRQGKLIKTESVESLTHQQFRRVYLTLRHSPPPGIFDLRGVTETGRQGRLVRLEVQQGLDRVMEVAVSYGIENIEIPPVTLEEIFLAFYDRQKVGGEHA
jgi:beta-exotoxin I transport system ATP-binding protein